MRRGKTRLDLGRRSGFVALRTFGNVAWNWKGGVDVLLLLEWGGGDGGVNRAMIG